MLPPREMWRAGPSGQPQSTLHSAESKHSLSAGLKVWSANGPETSKGRLCRTEYPVNLNQNPNQHSIFGAAPAAKRRARRARLPGANESRLVRSSRRCNAVAAR